MAQLIDKLCIFFIALIPVSGLTASDGTAALGGFIKRFTREISQEYGLKNYGTGVSFPKKIECIDLSFASDRIGNIRDARKLAVEITHKMITRINQDNNLKKYLSSTPASLKHVCLIIRFKDDDNEPLKSVMVIGSRGKVFYNAHNEAKTMLIDLHSETFEEAEKIVAQERLLR